MANSDKQLKGAPSNHHRDVIIYPEEIKAVAKIEIDRARTFTVPELHCAEAGKIQLGTVTTLKS